MSNFFLKGLSYLPIIGYFFKKKANKKKRGSYHLKRFPLLLQEIEKVYSQTLAMNHKVIAVTSATKGEGVSLMVKTLAMRNVLAGRKTLILDFNFDRPSIVPDTHQNTSGYYQYFGMSILTFEASNPLLVKLREPYLLRQYIDDWLKEYDSVLIDTAPFDTVSFQYFPTETICSAADGTVLMVMSSITSEALIVEAIEKLKYCKANLIGTVLNDYHNPGLKYELLRKLRWIRVLMPPLSRWLEYKIRNSRFLSLEI